MGMTKELQHGSRNMALIGKRVYDLNISAAFIGGGWCFCIAFGWLEFGYCMHWSGYSIIYSILTL
jgi:hypothetical protein